MKLYRIKAIMLRHLLLTFRVFQLMVDLMFWPFINIVIWGFNSVWNEQFQHQSPKLTLALVASLIVWQVLFRTNMEICFSLLDELRSHNFSAIFSTPLQLKEWMISVMGIGLLKSTFTFIFGMTCIWLLYGINILSLGLSLAPFIGLIILTGWSVGFLTASGIVYWGLNVQELVWVVAWIFVPFSGIFYSVKVLPLWAQYFSKLIPQSYIFEGLRSYVLNGVLDLTILMKATVLTIFYFVLVLIFFKLIFEKSRKNGLSRLENT
jgi:ABC-2 type transport system permease protein